MEEIHEINGFSEKLMFVKAEPAQCISLEVSAGVKDKSANKKECLVNLE